MKRTKTEQPLIPDQNHVSIQFYLTKDQKKLFKKACKDRGTTVSHELRRFIRAYIATPWQDDRVYFAPVKTSS